MEDSNMRPIIIEEKNLTAEQRKEIGKLQKHCFANVPQQEIEEDFYAIPIARALMYIDGELIGCAGIYKTEVDYEDRHIKLGGFGGICVKEDMRGRRIGKEICKTAMDVLYAEGCDMASLAIDLSKTTDQFYRKLGF